MNTCVMVRERLYNKNQIFLISCREYHKKIWAIQDLSKQDKQDKGFQIPAYWFHRKSVSQLYKLN